MPKIISTYYQHRQSIGHHTYWNDRKQSSQQQFNTVLKKIASRPGLHTGNVHRQNTAQAMVGLLSILSSVQISGANLGSRQNRNNELVIDYPVDKKPEHFSFSLNNGSLSIPHPINLRKIDFFRELPPPSNITKRSILYSDDIPFKILKAINNFNGNYQLRNTFDILFRLSRNSPEYRYAVKETKGLFLLMKFIQMMKIFVIKNESIKNNVFNEGRDMLDALMNIASEINNPHGKTIFDKFNDKYMSEAAVIRMMDLPDSIINKISQGKRFDSELIYFSNDEKDKIIFRMKRHLLNNFLSKNSQINYRMTSFEQVNSMIDYISGEGNENKMDMIVNILLEPVSIYERIEINPISEAGKMAAISDFLNYSILNMSLYSWCVSRIKNMRDNGRKIFNYGNVENKLIHLINTKSNKVKLSDMARVYYKNNVLGKLMPTLMLPLSSAERKKMKRMDFLQPQWGFVHAGAMLLNAFSVDVKNLILADFEDVGMALDLLIRNKIVPQEYILYFELPALLYYFSLDDRQQNLSNMNEGDINKIFISYFENTSNWMESNNPYTQLNNQANGWKSRTELAIELLKNHNVNEGRLSDYLNAHEKLTVITDGNYITLPNVITLPNIDEIFNKQNNDLADASCNVDKLQLLNLFNSSFSEEDIYFIQQSSVVSVAVEFNARESIYSAALPPSARIGIQNAHALIYSMPDHTDFFQCKLNDEKRIYALAFSNKTGSYQLKRVDYNREEMLSLLDDSSVPRRDKDYKLKVYPQKMLKKEGEPIREIINNLAESHRNKIFAELYNKGYDKTFNEKMGDFLLSLIPFYSCISESIKGNEKEAIPACIIDIISFIPFFGQVTRVGAKFSLSFGKYTFLSLKYGARQATLSGMLKQTAEKMSIYAPSVAKNISPQVVRNLGVGFLRSIDPGFELLELGGKAGIHAMEKVFPRWTDKSPGMVRLTNALKKNKGKSGDIFSENNVVHSNLNGGVAIKESILQGGFIKREIGDGYYIQYYTKPMENEVGSKVLVISAHGGFITSDTIAPVVVLPSDITIKMLTPHGTYLEDPGLATVVNRKSDFTAYATFTHGKLTDVKFTPQTENKEWLDVDGYDPNNIINTQGREEGLQNYRHYRYENESDEHISNVLIDNRDLAKNGKAELTDIITVSNRISDIGDTSLKEASVQKIIDLDKSGKLVNGNGERYKTIIFSHCRNDFLKSDKAISTYKIEPLQTDTSQSKGAKISNVEVTVLSRNDATLPFTIKHYSVGRFLFKEVMPFSENQ
ncbi:MULTISPECIES: putative adhesin [Pectobacterium]|uniref:Adhesin n=1 Tax=Pectobacterium parvum TaxID=2778550 RepID=A0ABW8G2Z2_9GAMM|nr:MULTISPECIES: hypothetical protein [Pectobacterium]MCU1800186.1 hypothetical protein [Pectobacterium parvum]GKW40948.1 hypothetical protein PEC301879_08070 [Pectobacterium carotovorum subsp. carotovorum]